MKVLKKLYFALVITLTCNIAEPKTNLLSTVAGVISFGKNIYSFFDSLFGGSSEPEFKIDYARIINSITERIDKSTEQIVLKIELQAYVSELRNVAQTVKGLLSEVMDIIEAKNINSSKEYSRRFQTSFGLAKIEIYKIKTLLSYRVDVSGISSSLLSLIAKTYECSFPRLWEFEEYYMTLVSDVVAMALLNEHFSVSDLYDETLAAWKTSTASLLADFTKQKDECEIVALGQAKSDFERISDPQKLFENNKEKYPHQINDVLKLGGSYCAWSLKTYDKLFRKAKGKTITFEFISSENNFISYDEKQQGKIATTTNIGNCRSDVGKVILYFDILGQDLVFWLMYPQSQAARFQILLDKNSSASTITESSKGTTYRTVIYLQEQSGNRRFTASDYNIDFHVLVSGSPPGMNGCQLGLTVLGSVLAYILF